MLTAYACGQASSVLTLELAATACKPQNASVSEKLLSSNVSVDCIVMLVHVVTDPLVRRITRALRPAAQASVSRNYSFCLSKWSA
ncbi:hypothetical protein BD310DRAFT_678173 [Dichomitus squalens]|uniref:Uncharacterized protein n=1 Tax=Dichomitus squalens TaxID=114155 RepID=A0A4Q9PN08_9APHY|nr:hypothetical protein BD310DRAFT_678173 [Dichomitus squalens]